MLTKNNWVQTNLENRFTNPASDFRISIRPYKFKEMSFQESADFTCREIAKQHTNLFLGLSGGMDSEFILRCFHKNKINVIPIIVVCGNKEEIIYAYKLCDELKIIPIVIEIDEKVFLKYYREYIYEKFNGVGYNATHAIVAAEFVNKESGTLITGNHFMGDGDDLISDEKYLLSNEWDFYIDYCFTNCKNVDFLLFTPEIAYSQMPTENNTWNKHKEKIYQIEYRKKMRPVYTKETINELKTMSMNRIPLKKTGEIWNKQKFLSTFKQHIEK